MLYQNGPLTRKPERPESRNNRPVIIEKSEVPEKQVRLDDPRANIYWREQRPLLQ